MRLKINNILGVRSPFEHLGQPTGVFESKEHLVISSNLSQTYWPARSIETYAHFDNRVSIFDLSNLMLLSYTDSTRFSVHDIAFHPSEPILALATGDYDGGYLFEGELLIWNWETNEIKNILDCSVEVLKCRFSNNGKTIDILTHPPDEGNFREDCFNKFFYFQGIPLSTSGYSANFTKPTKLENTGFSLNDPSQSSTIEKLQNIAAQTAKANYEQRTCIWDVSWLNQDSLACTSGEAILEIWDIDNKLSFYQKDKDFFGTELSVSTKDNSIFLNTIKKPNSTNIKANSGYSKIINFDTQNYSFQTIKEFNYAVTMSMSSCSSLLLRGTDYNSGDLLIQGQQERYNLDLGHYDCFNHYIRVNNHHLLFYLRGEPQDQHENKYISSIDPQDKSVNDYWPITWESDIPHLMQGTGCIFDECLVLSFLYYNANSNNPDKGFIAARRLSDGKLLWSLPIKCQVTTLVSIQDLGIVFYALTNGEIGLIKIKDGDVIHVEELKIDNVKSCVVSAAYNDQKIAAGTIDGRIIIFNIIP